ncbi:MAG TPA: hypothetical protein V6D20_05965, partial [Candidatus Obscuribacterales bacterium]
LVNPNIGLYPIITEDTPWLESSANVTKTHGQVDQDGGYGAVKVYFDGVDNHQQWIDLPQKLVPGHQYEIRVWVNPDTLEGFTDTFQVAYYDVSANLAGSNLAVTPGAGWQELVQTIPSAPDATNNDPSIRLLGFSNGAQFESILIGRMDIYDLTDADVTTPFYSATINNVSGAAIATHALLTPTWFRRRDAEAANVGGKTAYVPTQGTVEAVLTTDFNVDLGGTGVWGLDATDLMPAHADFDGQAYFRTNVEAGAYVGDTTLIRGSGWESRLLAGLEHAFLKYKVRFKPGVDFVKGGKLPGFYGGNSPSGGAPANNGFSSRMMFRTHGQGELYLYCMNSMDDFGASVARGSFRIVPGAVHTIEQEVKMNTLGQDDGFVRVWVDGKPVFEQLGVIFRDLGTVTIDGIMSTIFWGGGDTTWRTTQAEYVEHGAYEIFAVA